VEFLACDWRNGGGRGIVYTMDKQDEGGRMSGIDFYQMPDAAYIQDGDTIARMIDIERLIVLDAQRINSNA
jgi:hypothetical protein